MTMPQQRRSYVGYAYSKSSSNHNSTRRTIFTEPSSSLPGLYCSCDASHMQQELDSLRESTKNALQQSWNEVESLTKKCTDQEKETSRLRKELENANKCERKLETKIERLQKELNYYTGRRPDQKMNRSISSQCLNLVSSGSKNLILRRPSSLGSLATLGLDRRASTNESKNESSHNSDFDVASNGVPGEFLSSTVHTMPILKRILNTPEEAPSSIRSLDDVKQLKLKLERREKEIKILEKTIVENVKNMQLLLHVKHSHSVDQDDKENPKEHHQENQEHSKGRGNSRSPPRLRPQPKLQKSKSLSKSPPKPPQTKYKT